MYCFAGPRSSSSPGCSGIIIPDIPLEEASSSEDDSIQSIASAAGLELILLATPTTPKERLAQIADASQGFIYLVSVAGVTGTRESVATEANEKLQELRDVTKKPIAIGFGISKPEHAQQVGPVGHEKVDQSIYLSASLSIYLSIYLYLCIYVCYILHLLLLLLLLQVVSWGSDGVIVGSALVKIVSQCCNSNGDAAADGKAAAETASEFLRSLKSAMKTQKSNQ